ETLVALIRTGIAYAGFATAAVLTFAELIGGGDRLAALAGASFLLILVGFAVQRVLTDIIAGFAMFAERWYGVGDTIAVSGLELQGGVEDVSLRRTKLRTLDGESIHIHNSQIPAVKVLPRGVKELAIELFVSDREAGADLCASVAAPLPRRGGGRGRPRPRAAAQGPDDVRAQAVGRGGRRAFAEPGPHRTPRHDGPGPRVAARELLLRPAQGAGRARPDPARADRARGRRERFPQLRPRER